MKVLQNVATYWGTFSKCLKKQFIRGTLIKVPQIVHKLGAI
jgi:hypothetical protein